MKSSDFNWNDSIRNNSCRSSLKMPKSSSICLVDFLKEVWDLFILLFCLLLFFVMIVGIPLTLYFGIKENIEVNRAIQARENELKSLRWQKVPIHNSDDNSAELLARKRADTEFGLNNYIFKSTNFHGNVWYIAKPK